MHASRSASARTSRRASRVLGSTRRGALPRILTLPLDLSLRSRTYAHRTQIVDQNTANTIVFTFLEGIHRVVQTDGSLNAPCSPAGQFDTGVQTVPAGSNGPSFTFSVDNNTAEYYFADIGEDYSPCYLGAVLYVALRPSSDRSKVRGG